jgi:hypothetical protein
LEEWGFGQFRPLQRPETVHSDIGDWRGFINETEPDVSEFSQTDDLILYARRRLCRPRAAG